jgi:hypothetical protein
VQIGQGDGLPHVQAYPAYAAQRVRPVPVLLIPSVVDPLTIAQSRAREREGTDDTLSNQSAAMRRYVYIIGAQPISPTPSSQCRNPPLAAWHAASVAATSP